jgi:hypothetical protein
MNERQKWWFDFAGVVQWAAGLLGLILIVIVSTRPVTVWSGGKAVEYWIVDELPQVSNSGQVTQFSGRIVIGGPVVIEPHKTNGRPF